MARNYGAVWNGTNTQSTSTPIMTLTGATTIRVKLYEIEPGSDAVPADNAGTFLIQRHSTAITGGTAATASPLDAADPATLAVYMYGASIGAPTLGAKLFQFTHNQRTTFRWQAIPGKELVIPATSNAGLSCLPSVVGSSAVNYAGTWFYEE
jgi:hypothetical protein